MSKRQIAWLALASLLVSCGGEAAQCLPAAERSAYLAVPPETLPTPTPRPSANPLVVKIGERSVSVDQVVEGPLCHGAWKGTVYVTCDVQVYPWEGQPTFLQKCDLAIEPGTVVYVAYHGNAAYYQGCSCHVGPAGK